jgi:hypothetical protein
MLVLLGFLDKNVQVGLNPDHLIPQHERHGTVVVRHGRQDVKLPYTVDRPDRLKRPHVDAIKNMFQQFERLGHVVQAIEITVGKYRRVYRMQGDKLEKTQQSLK